MAAGGPVLAGDSGVGTPKSLYGFIRRDSGCDIILWLKYSGRVDVAVWTGKSSVTNTVSGPKSG